MGAHCPRKEQILWDEQCVIMSGWSTMAMSGKEHEGPTFMGLAEGSTSNEALAHLPFLCLILPSAGG